MTIQFSRNNPSARYRRLIDEHRALHRDGEKRLGLPASEVFAGTSLIPHIGEIRDLIGATESRTILDYGSGKGLQYRPHAIVLDAVDAESIAEYWDVDVVKCYDPAVPEFARLPDERFDGVICTDVLEHCPKEDLPWIARE